MASQAPATRGSKAFITSGRRGRSAEGRGAEKLQAAYAAGKRCGSTTLIGNGPEIGVATLSEITTLNAFPFLQAVSDA